MTNSITLKSYNGIILNTRANVRTVVALLKAAGQVAVAVDRGEKLKGAARWGVSVESNAPRTLVSPRKPSGDMFASYEMEILEKSRAVQNKAKQDLHNPFAVLKTLKDEGVKVFHKKTYRRRLLGC
ncbi:hypothetical protein NVP1121O_122 [Vibrio phage 1.121.O._10N.286.46.C4]|nr:hypothetical protein NVP1121O_122 [Vibrio phage 1.121.O._10N.286.46.C4]